MANEQTAAYGKRPMWHWVLIYVVGAAVVYGLFYYFVLAKGNTYVTPTAGASVQTQTTGSAPTPPAPAPGY